MKDLEDDCTFLVSRVKELQTKFGFSVVVELDEEYQVFLPKRICTMLQVDRDTLNSLIAKAEARELFFHHLTAFKFEFK